MRYYTIVHLSLSISDNVYLEDSWNRFSSHTEKDDLEISYADCTERVKSYGIYKCDLKECDNYVLTNELATVTVSTDWKKCRVIFTESWENANRFFRQIFYIHAVQKHVLQMHSSLIEHQGRGLLFLGPSGIGKTTQAELWAKYRNALIINGDIVFVQETKECFLGWGTPWHGSSPYCENASVPVHAMVVLKQAEENSIRELTGFEKVSEVSNSIFYPQWLENGMELCLETLDHLLREIPVYELSCRPDEAAVELTEQTIFYRK
ncbi:MAG: hypothetical protein ACLU61_00770 [Lachnospiraceae bacterium]